MFNKLKVSKWLECKLALLNVLRGLLQLSYTCCGDNRSSDESPYFYLNAGNGGQNVLNISTKHFQIESLVRSRATKRGAATQ